MGIRFPQLRHTTHKMTLSSVRSSQLLGRIAELEIQAEREGQLNRGFPTASSLCSSATPKGELCLLVSLLMCVLASLLFLVTWVKPGVQVLIHRQLMVLFH